MRRIDKPTDNADMNILGSNKTEEGAMRLMEALSAVDESLLERCEGSADATEVKETRKNKIYNARIFNVPVWKIGSAFAAVLCVAVVGVALQGGVSVNESSTDAYIQYTSMTSENSAEEGNKTSDIGVTSDTAEASTVDSLTGNGTNSSDIVSEETKEVEKEDREVNDNTRLHVVENSITDSLKEWLAGLGAMEEKSTAEVAADDMGKVSAVAEIAEADMYELDVVGAYVPTVLPEGYAFDVAYVSGEGEEVSLTVYWIRGMDTIMLRIGKAEDREVFADSVCVSEDFCREFVEKRMIYREDRGDTDTPRGNFSVLYSDGIAVEFNGRGTAEEIWEMFCSINGYSEN